MENLKQHDITTCKDEIVLSKVDSVVSVVSTLKSVAQQNKGQKFVLNV